MTIHTTHIQALLKQALDLAAQVDNEGPTTPALIKLEFAINAAHHAAEELEDERLHATYPGHR